MKYDPRSIIVTFRGIILTPAEGTMVTYARNDVADAIEFMQATRFAHGHNMTPWHGWLTPHTRRCPCGVRNPSDFNQRMLKGNCTACGRPRWCLS